MRAGWSGVSCQFDAPEGPTQAEVDSFISESKYIQTLPEVAEGEREDPLRAEVFRAANRGRPTGMVIMATAKKSPPVVPRPWPSAALELSGHFRIRGLNYAVRHDCPSGPIVQGWHEHVWTNGYDDRGDKSQAEASGYQH